MFMLNSSASAGCMCLKKWDFSLNGHNFIKIYQIVAEHNKEDTSYWARARCYELTNDFRTYGSASAGDKIQQLECYGK